MNIYSLKNIPKKNSIDTNKIPLNKTLKAEVEKAQNNKITVRLESGKILELNNSLDIKKGSLVYLTFLREQGDIKVLLERYLSQVESNYNLEKLPELTSDNLKRLFQFIGDFENLHNYSTQKIKSILKNFFLPVINIKQSINQEEAVRIFYEYKRLAAVFESHADLTDPKIKNAYTNIEKIIKPVLLELMSNINVELKGIDFKKISKSTFLCKISKNNMCHIPELQNKKIIIDMPFEFKNEITLGLLKDNKGSSVFISEDNDVFNLIQNLKYPDNMNKDIYEFIEDYIAKNLKGNKTSYGFDVQDIYEKLKLITDNVGIDDPEKKEIIDLLCYIKNKNINVNIADAEIFLKEGLKDIKHKYIDLINELYDFCKKTIGVTVNDQISNFNNIISFADATSELSNEQKDWAVKFVEILLNIKENILSSTNHELDIRNSAEKSGLFYENKLFKNFVQNSSNNLSVIHRDLKYNLLQLMKMIDDSTLLEHGKSELAEKINKFINMIELVQIKNLPNMDNNYLIIPAIDPDSSDNIYVKIKKRFRKKNNSSSDKTNINIKLSPSNIGDMECNLLFKGNKNLIVDFVFNNEKNIDIFNRNINTLSNKLNSQGFNLEGLNFKSKRQHKMKNKNNNSEGFDIRV